MTLRAKDSPPRPETLQGAGLKIRNVTIAGQRTSIRLEPTMWDALDEICRIEKMTRNQVCSLVKERHAPGSTLTAAIRVFIVAYFWEAAKNSNSRIPRLESGQLGRLLGDDGASSPAAGSAVADDPARSPLSDVIAVEPVAKD